jgi:hypothetical protein
MKTVLLLAALLVFVVAALLALAHRQWTLGTADAVALLNRAAPAPAPGGFAPALLDSLPPPVARYLRAALRDGTPRVRLAVVGHDGSFRSDLARAEEAPFRSVEHFDASPAGFVWDARMRVAPALDVFVRDMLVDGRASMRGRLAGLYPVVEAQDDAQLDAAALQRWLGETVWFPTALLPGGAVTWTALDDSTARAWASLGTATVSLDFRFGADSLVSHVRTDARGRAVGGSIVPTPWRCDLYDWQWRRGMRIPVRGEVAWELVTGPAVYWRGRVTDVTYE